MRISTALGVSRGGPGIAFQRHFEVLWRLDWVRILAAFFSFLWLYNTYIATLLYRI